MRIVVRVHPGSRQPGVGGSHDGMLVVRVAAREAHKKGDIPTPVDGDFPAHAKAYRDLSDLERSQMMSIAMERHRALNWLCGFAPENRWDETPTDT